MNNIENVSTILTDLPENDQTISLIDNKRAMVSKIILNFEVKYPGSKVIYAVETGSGLHGTSINDYEGDNSSATSDFDVKVIYMPSLNSLVCGDLSSQKNIEVNSNKDEKNGANDIDVSFIPLNDFMSKLTMDMEMNAVELLFSMMSSKVLYETEESNLIKRTYKSLVFRKTEAMVNAATSMTMKLSIPGKRVTELKELSADVHSAVKNAEVSNKAAKKTSLTDIGFDFSKYNADNGFKSIYITSIRNEDSEKDYLYVLGKRLDLNIPIAKFEKNLSILINTFGGKKKATSGSEVEAEDLNNAEYKKYANALRAITQAMHLLTTGYLVYPIHNALEVLEVKYSRKQSRAELSEMIDELQERLLLLKNEESVLQDRVDQEFVMKLKLKLYNLD